MNTNNKTQRLPILVTREQKESLVEYSKERGVPVSEIVRELIDSLLSEVNERKLEGAALRLIDEYVTNEDLTSFTALDAEDFS